MNHTSKTLEKIAHYTALGYTIIEGNNHRLPSRKKYHNHEVIRLAQTNSRIHGLCINTVYAIKKI